jgi:hypothetical protein
VKHWSWQIIQSLTAGDENGFALDRLSRGL